MKTMKTTMILMAAILVSSVAHASGKVNLSMKPVEKELAMVEITNEARDEVKIEVLDELGEVIFSKTVVEPIANYKRKYDFKGLEDGSYILKVNSGKEKNETKFDIARGFLTVTGERKEIEPHVAKAGNTFKLSYLNFPLEKMNLFVYEGSNLLYQEKLEPVFAVHKGLDLSSLLPGNYQIVFANDYNAYEYNMKVE